MTDATTRAKERTGGGLMERLRADELPAYTVARDVACSEGTDCAEWGACPGGCKGTGRVPYERLDLLRVLAFLGVEEARESLCLEQTPGGLRGFEPSWLWWDQKAGLEQWLDGLSLLLAKLPPHRLEVECANCRHGVVSLGPRCRRCQVTDTPAECWLLANAALAVAWECWARPQGRLVREIKAEAAAMNACADWVAEPTADLWHSWQRRWPQAGVAWVPGVEPARALQAAALVLGEPRVREVVTAGLLGRLL